MTSFRSELGPGGECIQLVHCIAPTEQQRNDPKYLPQLLVNKDAQRRIETNFRAPISVLVLVGNMGVGKSKLASVIVNSFYKQHPEQSLRLFRSGAGVSGVTQGVWMWSEPLEHPDGQGSILLLDCEGMGDLDENVGANLYLFCMLISTSFALLIRPARIERSQCERLYHALLRFEHMKTPHVLPNLWIVALEMPEFIQNQEDGDDVVITKEEWMKQIFDVDGNKHKKMAAVDVNTLKQRYDYINRMLIKKDAINISFIPDSLKRDRQDLDIWKLWNDSGAQEYQQSVLRARKQLLSTGGKRMLGSTNSMYIRPAEFSSLMERLIEVINNDRVPNPDSLIERYLRDRFMNDIVSEQKALFEKDLYTYAADTVSVSIRNRKRAETEEEHVIADNEMSNARRRLTRQYISKMIGAARFNIFGLDPQMAYDYRTRDDEQQALKALPKSIQNELIAIESSMNHFQKPEMLIQDVRSKMIIADAHQREEQARKIAMEAEEVRKQQQALAEQERKKTDALRTEREKAAENMREAQANAQRFQQQAEEHRAASERAFAEQKKAISDKENYQKQAEEYRRIAEQEKAEQARYEAAAAEEKRKAEEAKNISLATKNVGSNQWLVKTDLCPTCKVFCSNNVVHGECPSGRVGNWYYYDRSKNQMVCEACRSIITASPENVCCSKCKTSLRVIEVL